MTGFRAQPRPGVYSRRSGTSGERPAGCSTISRSRGESSQSRAGRIVARVRGARGEPLRGSEHGCDPASTAAGRGRSGSALTRFRARVRRLNSRRFDSAAQAAWMFDIIDAEEAGQRARLRHELRRSGPPTNGQRQRHAKPGGFDKASERESCTVIRDGAQKVSHA